MRNELYKKTVKKIRVVFINKKLEDALITFAIVFKLRRMELIIANNVILYKEISLSHIGYSQTYFSTI